MPPRISRQPSKQLHSALTWRYFGGFFFVHRSPHLFPTTKSSADSRTSDHWLPRSPRCIPRFRAMGVPEAGGQRFLCLSRSAARTELGGGRSLRNCVRFGAGGFGDFLTDARYSSTTFIGGARFAGLRLHLVFGSFSIRRYMRLNGNGDISKPGTSISKPKRGRKDCSHQSRSNPYHQKSKNGSSLAATSMVVMSKKSKPRDLVRLFRLISISLSIVHRRRQSAPRPS